ncbi:hypothetical protein ZOSMA_4G00710 [Zostera marina]|uniref:Uncharacterized protein n=1 Tax=Zostera marina TaxID=29655 RepID=A0A0K9NYK5_ZOSMR|nr:hypothetical protein ZOSMA_4G00710 [Zostera marina]
MFLFSNIENDLDSTFLEFEGDRGLPAQINEFQNRLIKSEYPILCKIPNSIRVNHEKEYEPQIIAIGPYHRNRGHLGQINPRLKHMENIKLKFLSDLCKAMADNNENLALSYLHLFHISMEYLCLRNDDIETVQHLLHLYHIGKVKGSMHFGIDTVNISSIDDQIETLMMIPTISQLKEHGIQFRKKKVKIYTRGISFLDIFFKNGIIEIPHVIIEDNTSSIYCNLLVFE